MASHAAARPKGQAGRKRARRLPASARPDAASGGASPAPGADTASPFGATDQARGPSSIEHVGEGESGSIEAVKAEAPKDCVPGFVEPVGGDDAAAPSRGH